MVDKPSLGRRFIYEYLQALDCPRALSVWLLYSHKEHEQLCQIEFNPCDYNTVTSARDALAASKFLSKHKDLETQWDKRTVALEKFFEAEQVCRQTNRRIRLHAYTHKCAEPIVSSMAWKIARILGEFDAEEFVDACNWGPGASTGIPRRRATLPNKYQSQIDITPACHDFVVDWVRSAYPSWDMKFQTRVSNKIVTVPKDSKTDRTIAIEPGFNLWCQKGIGAMLRRRLKVCGIDLDDQSHNQERSRIASKFNHLATVDFSSASDTIAYNLVQDLIPGRWLHVMNRCRSSCGTVDGNIVKYEKYSSMGNGFTFELETLIFYVLAVCCCEQKGVDHRGISVYGDDVIIPSEIYELYSSVSADLGFCVNKKKSYSSTYYRESCGAHYWNGIDVKPYFHKEPLNDTDAILKAANSVRRSAHRRNTYGCDRRLRRCWTLLSGALGKQFPRISEGFGDVALIGNFDEATPTKARHGIEGFYVSVTSVAPVQYMDESAGLLLTRLKSLGSGSYELLARKLPDLAYGNKIPMPGRTKKRRIKLLVPRWYDLGPWI